MVYVCHHYFGCHVAKHSCFGVWNVVKFGHFTDSSGYRALVYSKKKKSKAVRILSLEIFIDFCKTNK